MKRFGRRLKKGGMTFIIMAIFVGITWLMSHMGGILEWFMQNWLPILVGFVIAIIGNAVTDFIMGEENQE